MQASPPPAETAGVSPAPGKSPHRPRRELLAFAAVALVTLLRWWPEIVSPVPRTDERVYLPAIERVLDGRSPYDDTYFYYPPDFAYASAWVVRATGVLPYLKGLRALSLLGACVAVWLAMSLPERRWPILLRFALAVVYLTWSDAVDVAVQAANIAGLITGMMLLALVVWPRRPIVAGVLLAVSLVIKPLAPLAPLLLLLHRPADGPRASRIAAVVAVLLAVLLLLPFTADLGGFLEHAQGGWPTHPRNLSLTRLLYCFGLEIPPIVIFSTVALVSALWLRRRRLTDAQLVAAIGVATLLALPVIWIHTLMLSLPVQCLAIDRLVRRPTPRDTAMIFAVLALASSFLSHAAGVVPSWPLWAQGLLLVAPVLSPAYLLSWTIRND